MRSPAAPSVTCAEPALRIRGGGDDVPKPKTIRIPAFDSLRFFLIVNIVLGHFIRFASPSTNVFKLCSQHNVIVGAFFALSGYVTAYTSTKVGEPAVSPKLSKKHTWILSRVMGYWPLHMITLILFSPVFLFADVHYNGWKTSALNGILSATMTTAWFPNRAEVWNAPTWFLSALTLANTVLPFCLPTLAGLNATALTKTGWWIWGLAYVLPKLAYVTDYNLWKIPEGVMSPKTHPNYSMFNTQRFSPLYAVPEVLLGVICCRIVMMDTECKKSSTMVPLGILLAGMVARMYVSVNDMLFRSVFFVPVFLRLLMAAHRNTVNGEQDALLGILNSKFLVWLGGLSFPIFISHGPIGQIFYKKLIANKLWGKVLQGPGYFGLYGATVLVVSMMLQKLVLQNSSIKSMSKSAVDKLSSWV